MAFHGSTLEVIVQDINVRRQQQKITFAKVRVSDDEYFMLRQRAREIFRAGGSPNKSGQIVFLAFACAYVQRNVYLKDYSFWEDFHVELEAPMDTYSDFIADKLLWPSYEAVGIQRLGKQKRQIVDSLVTAVCTEPLATYTQFVDFFCWFYQCTSDQEVSGATLQNYQKYTGQQLPIAITAHNRLNHDCTFFATIIDFIYEHAWSLTQDTVEAQQQCIITDAMQKKYQQQRVRLLLKDNDLLQSILQRLENHTTPERFLAELKRAPTRYIQPSLPELDRFTLKTYNAGTLPYDYYEVGKRTYRVGPFPWLWLETIEQWPHEEIIKLRRQGYIAYKKHKSFSVKVGDKAFNGRLSANGEGKSCYIWTGKIIPGELVSIDGQFWEEAIGLTWSYTLALGFSQEHEPVLHVVPTSLNALLPASGDARLVLRTSQGNEEQYLHPSEWLEKNGQWLSYRGRRFISWELQDWRHPLRVSISANGEVLDEKMFVPEQAYLFSEYTHECILPNTKREWGVRSFYLFVAPHLHPQTSPSVSLESLPTALCGYSVYRIEWDVKERPFELQVGELNWSITQQRYCFLQIQRAPSDGPVHLTKQQIQRFSGQQLLLWTNLELPSTTVTCLALIMNEEVKIQGDLLACETNLYTFSAQTIQQLNEMIIGQHLYGDCDLIIMQDEQILAQTTVVIIPEIEVKLPPIGLPLLEGTSADVDVNSPCLELWNAMKEHNDHQVRLHFRPTVTSESWLEQRNDLSDVRWLVPATVHLPLTFPTIGQSVEIRVRLLVFGFRLYQQQGDRRYQCIDEVDYYHLDTALLYIFTQPNAQVSFYVKEQFIHSMYVDAIGNLVINDITRFKTYCTSECTTIRIVCANLTNSFAIRWTPRVYEWHAESTRARITMDGPLNTAVLVRLVTADNEELARQHIRCRGRRFSVPIDTREAAYTEKLCYLVPGYCLSDGSVIPSAQQWRLARHKMWNVPREWFSMGIGCSDEVLLRMLMQ